jgi:hypothetical protein
LPKDFITPQQARHIKERHERELNDIRKTANNAGRATTGEENKRIKVIKGIIADAEAVIRGDGRKGRR